MSDESLEQVLADERGQAQTLRFNGYRHDAELIERVCDRVARVMEDHLKWLGEKDAQLRSGRGVDYFRSRRAGWLASGDAKKEGNTWKYRQSVVPLRANLSAAREAGRQAGLRRTA